MKRRHCGSWLFAFPAAFAAHLATASRQQLDGAGRPVKRVETRRTETLNGQGPTTTITTSVTTTYYVRSSLTGDLFSELNEQGGKTKGYIHALGGRLAEQVGPAPNYGVLWRHSNPVTGTLLKGTANGVFGTDARTEFDPFGVEVGNYDLWATDPTPSYQELKGSEPLYIEGGDPFNLRSGCTRDGLPISCSEAYRLARSGSVTDSSGADVPTLPGGVILYGVFGEKYVNGDYAGEGLVDVGSLWLPLAQQQRQRQNPCENQVLTHFPNLRDASNDVPIVSYLNSSVAADFTSAIAEINTSLARALPNNPGLPQSVGFTEVFRTTARQQELWNARQERIRRGQPAGNPVAQPGTSRHEGGFAFDVNGIVRRDVQGIEREAYLAGGYARYRGTNEYVLTAFGQIAVPIFDRYGFNWLGHRQIDPPHFEADPTQHGYRTRGEAIRAAQEYYRNCIEGAR